MSLAHNAEVIFAAASLWAAAPPRRSRVASVCPGVLNGAGYNRIRRRQHSPITTLGHVSFGSQSVNFSEFELRKFSEITKNLPTMQGSADVDQVDVLLVGAGFASYTLLNRYVCCFLPPVWC